MRRGALVTTAVVVVLLGGAAAGWFLAGPGTGGSGSGGSGSGGSGGPTTTAHGGSAPASPAAADVARIKKDWQAFFDSKTPLQRKIALLQNGARFAGPLKSMATSPVARGVTARVDHVQMINPTTATVTYDVLLNGQPVLNNRAGVAVLSQGTWKVGDQAFCRLISLSGSRPAACTSPSAAPSSTRSG